MDEQDLNERFDAVVVCGVFNLRVASVMESLKNAIKNLFELTEGFIILDLLTCYVRQKDVQLNLVNPSDMLDYIIKNITTHVFLYHRPTGDNMVLLIFKDRNLINKMI